MASIQDIINQSLYQKGRVQEISVVRSKIVISMNIYEYKILNIDWFTKINVSKNASPFKKLPHNNSANNKIENLLYNKIEDYIAVSYTHLTLPTICSV